MKELLGDYETFVRGISEYLNESGIGRDELAMMDHICYRVATDERYRVMRRSFSTQALMIGETEVSGRMITTFEFKEYLKVDGWIIPYLELPAPKDGSPYPEGLEHEECVVLGSLEKFLKRHNNLSFSHKGMDKLINPEAGLKEANVSVKFHEQPLGAVVRIENRLAGRGIS